MMREGCPGETRDYLINVLPLLQLNSRLIRTCFLFPFLSFLSFLSSPFTITYDLFTSGILHPPEMSEHVRCSPLFSQYQLNVWSIESLAPSSIQTYSLGKRWRWKECFDDPIFALSFRRRL